MDQTKQERPVWIKEVLRAARAGAVIAAVITIIGGIPVFMIMTGSDPNFLKILESLGSLAIAFLGYWLVCSFLAGVVRLIAKGLARLLTGH